MDMAAKNKAALTLLRSVFLIDSPRSQVENAVVVPQTLTHEGGSSPSMHFVEESQIHS
jgi:hypothetical protein